MESVDINNGFMCDTPALLKEIGDCAITKTGGVLKIPLQVFQRYLIDIARRAAELNDPQLNILMLQMKLYEVPHDQIISLIEKQKERLEVTK